MPLCKQCSRHATFGFRNSTPTACKEHKQEKMIDLKHPPCLFCDRRPSFAAHAGQPATHCKLHKVEGMQNVKHPLCSLCGAYASFGYVKNRPLRCQAHKVADMTNVKATMCLQENCPNAKPKYGNGTVGRAFCELHFDPRQHWKVTTCCFPLCLSIATHSEQGMLPFVYCAQHTIRTFVPAHLTTCTLCETEALCDAQDKCYNRCNTAKQTTEVQLKQFFQQKQLTFVHNRCAPNSSKRPDFLFQTAYGHVIVENDEHKHSGLSLEKEEQRMSEIQQAFQTHVHFIRFNPDLTPTHIEPLAQRHEQLFENLMSVLNRTEEFFSQNQGLTVRYLFY